MLHVYLDQNKWIDLARADRGRDDRYLDVLDLAREGAKLGIASFPLSSTHYMETWNHRRGARRHELAYTMLKLARPGSSVGPHSIAGPPEVVPMELDIALQRRFHRQLLPRRYAVFGEGVGHAFGRTPYRYRAPAELSLTPKERDRIEYSASRLLEAAALAGPGADLPVDGIDSESYKKFSLRYMEREEKLASLFRDQGIGKENRSRWLAALSILDILDRLNEALSRAGMSFEEFLSLGEEGMTGFLNDVPSRYVDYELHRLRHDNPQLKRTRGDLDDLAALSVAVVYCDVVVTERLWVDLIGRAGLDRAYDTKVLSDLRELGPVLAAAV